MPGLGESASEGMAVVDGSLPEHPWIVEVVLASLDQQYCKTVIKIGQTSCNNAPGGSTCNSLSTIFPGPSSYSQSLTSAYDNINLLWNRHNGFSPSCLLSLSFG